MINPMYFFLIGSSLFLIKAAIADDTLSAIVASMFILGCLTSLKIIVL